MTSAYDVLIVGGAVHGASVAYHLAADPAFDGRVLLIEKDPTFQFAATSLSAGSIRQQFSTPTNIAISLFGIDFLRAAGERLEVDGERPDRSPRRRLPVPRHRRGRGDACPQSRAADRHGRRHCPSRSGRAPRPLSLSRHGGDRCRSWGRSGEGWFDGYTFMQALRRKARALGVETLAAEVATIEQAGQRATGIRLVDGTMIAAGAVLLAAGTGATALARDVGVMLPVEARKRMVFTFACREPLPAFPLLIDPSGVYVRPEGDIYICGASPAADRDPPATDFDVDHAFFEETIWPVLAARVPAFEAIKAGRAWAGHYDFNTFDQNAIVGRLPGFSNLLVAAGFWATACNRRRLSAANLRIDRPRPLHEPRPQPARLRAHRTREAACGTECRLIVLTASAAPRQAETGTAPLGEQGR